MPLFPGAKPCLRSGFCCKQATCTAGLIYGAAPKGCKFLRGNKPGFYSCGLVEDKLINPQELYIGEGCCSPINTDRKQALLNNPSLKTT